MFPLRYLIIKLLATAQLSTAAKGQFGLCLGNQRTDKSLKSTADFVADLQAITKATAGQVKLVRTYGAGGVTNPTAAGILQAAKQEGFQVLLGAWVTSDDSLWQAEKAALLAAIPGYEAQVYGITVGSEGLYRKYTVADPNGYTGDQLAKYLKDAQTTWPNIPIGTADTTSSYVQGWADPAIALGPSMLLANAFPYWVDQFIQNATANFFDQILGALNHIQKTSRSNSIHFIVGETGWPADHGSDFGNAHASTVNAQAYFDHVICRALNAGIDVFLFEAFDEPGKGSVQVPLSGESLSISEMSWGVMDAGRIAKLNLTCPDP